MENDDDFTDSANLLASLVEHVNALDSMRVATRKLIYDAAERAAKYKNAVRFIWGASIDGRPDHIDSCLLIEVSDEKFILTAAHVVDWASKTAIYIGLEKLEELPNEFETSIAPNHERDLDVIDYAIMRFPAPLLSKLGDAIFIPDAKIGVGSPVENRYFTCLGFPNSQNKTPPWNATVVRGKQRSYTSRGRAATQLPGRAQADVHVLVDYNAKFSRDSDGLRVNSGKPNGVSGGAIFDIGALDSLDHLLQPELPRLAAIFIEAHRNQKVVMGTRVEYILDDLRNKGWL